jgi:hypothetical protein
LRKLHRLEVGGFLHHFCADFFNGLFNRSFNRPLREQLNALVLLYGVGRRNRASNFPNSFRDHIGYGGHRFAKAGNG